MGAGLDINLSQCCEKCRRIPSCIIWYYNSKICYFYSSFSSLFTTNVDTFVGIRTNSQFWNCKEEVGKFYYDANLKWEIQLISSSKINVASCCYDCFWSKGTVDGCKSYMFNDETRDCYHTNISFIGTAFVEFQGIITGESFLINLEDFQIESQNSSEKSSVSLYIYILSACGVLVLVAFIFSVYKCKQKARKKKQIEADRKYAEKLQESLNL
jgi:hypothetical protein